MGPCTANARRPTVDIQCRGTTINCCVADPRRCLSTTSLTGVQQSARYCGALPCRHLCMMIPSLYVRSIFWATRGGADHPVYPTFISPVKQHTIQQTNIDLLDIDFGFICPNCFSLFYVFLSSNFPIFYQLFYCFICSIRDYQTDDNRSIMSLVSCNLACSKMGGGKSRGQPKCYGNGSPNSL